MTGLLQAVTALIEQRTGLRFTDERRPDLDVGLESLRRERGLSDAVDAARWLVQVASGAAWMEAIGAHFTVGETYFFRDRALFTQLADQVLPGLIQRRHESHRLRLWSAGCASGEEPYSLAMLVNEALAGRTGWQMDLVGTDLNVRALHRAAAAVYGAWSFRECPAAVHAAYFVPRAKGAFALCPEIREAVRFVPLNLLDDFYPAMAGSFDLILCRHVLMYLSPTAAAQVLARLGAALANDGWLILGATEMPPEPPPGLVLANLGDMLALRRAEACPRRAIANGVGDCAAASLSARWRGPAPGVPRGGLRPRALIPDTRASEGRACLDVARRCADVGRWPEARRWCERGIAADKLDPRYCLLYALVLDEEGYPDAASEWLERTLYLEPDCVMAHVALGDLATRRRQMDTSGRHFRNALAALTKQPREAAVADADGITVAALASMLRAAAGERLD